MNKAESIAKSTSGNGQVKQWHLKNELSSAMGIKNRCANNTVDKNLMDYIFYEDSRFEDNFDIIFIDPKNKENVYQSNVNNYRLFGLRSVRSDTGVLGFSGSTLFELLRFVHIVKPMGFGKWFGIDPSTINFAKKDDRIMIVGGGSIEEFEKFKVVVKKLSRLIGGASDIVSRKLKSVRNKLDVASLYVGMFDDFITSIGKQTELKNYNIFELMFGEANSFSEDAMEVMIGNFVIDILDLVEQMSDYFIVFSAFHVESGVVRV